jgi:hypothetical protein
MHHKLIGPKQYCALKLLPKRLARAGEH